MPTAVHKLSWEDIKDLPETAGRTEIVDGELIVSPTPALVTSACVRSWESSWGFSFGVTV